jgi:hypothetical protein
VTRTNFSHGQINEKQHIEDKKRREVINFANKGQTFIWRNDFSNKKAVKALKEQLGCYH